MTKTEWLACLDPMAMLDCVKEKATDRKLRLFACACCRHVWDLLSSEAQAIIAVVEQCADGNFNLEDLRRRLRVDYPNGVFDAQNTDDWGWLRRRLREQDPEWFNEDELREIEEENGWFPEILFLPNAARSARITANAMCSWKETNVRWDSSGRNRTNGGDLPTWAASWDELLEKFDTNREVARDTELAWQVAVLHDLFSPLYFPAVIDLDWLSWNHGTVSSLARRIHDEGRFRDMPILADALEDAGCKDQNILQHCRQEGDHALGCWVVEILL